MAKRRIYGGISSPAIGRRQCLAVLGWLSLGGSATESSQAFAADVPDFRIIVHSDNPRRSVSRQFLARAFMKEVTEWSDGETLHPVDLRADSKTREKFSAVIIKRTVAAMRSYWQQRIFSGTGLPPPELDSDDDVVRYVLKFKGSVGYVSGRADLGAAKALTVDYD